MASDEYLCSSKFSLAAILDLCKLPELPKVASLATRLNLLVEAMWVQISKKNFIGKNISSFVKFPIDQYTTTTTTTTTAPWRLAIVSSVWHWVGTTSRRKQVIVMQTSLSITDHQRRRRPVVTPWLTRRPQRYAVSSAIPTAFSDARYKNTSDELTYLFICFVQLTNKVAYNDQAAYKARHELDRNDWLLLNKFEVLCNVK